MTSLTLPRTLGPGQIVVGVDTHKSVHVAVALDHNGAHLGELHFPSTRVGTGQVQQWARDLGQIEAWGIEGTASYGAGLSWALLGEGESVLEVNRPDRHARRTLGGKSDPIDAEAAARAVLSGRASAGAKTGDGPVEMLRHLRMARSSAVKGQTVAMNQIKAVLITAPPALREHFAEMTPARLIDALSALEPGQDLTVQDVVESTLQALALRWRTLQAEARVHHARLCKVLTEYAPKLLAEHGLGPDTVAALLIAAGDNPERLHSEAAFAALCGVSPLPASSGQTNRHRLNRGGDRQANAALHRIVLVRLVRHEETRTFMAARRSPNRANTKHLMRCLKRYLARRLYPLILEASRQTQPTAIAA